MDSLVAAAIGLGGGVTLTPLVRRIALRFGIVDRPGDLKTHRVPVAYLGGVAVFVAALAGPLSAGHPWVLVPMLSALGLGLADDLRPLPVPFRIVTEIGIAITAALSVPGPPLARVATAVLVLGLLNAVNLLDGQDGLAAGVGAVGAIGFAIIGGSAAPVGLALAGALVGFLVYNRPPARIYLGDAGAYLVGTSLALLPALTRGSATRWSIWWAVPLLVGVPVADTAIAILRRLRLRQSLLSGDRSHGYDQLVDRGRSVGQSTLICISAQVVLTALGIGATRASPAWALTITIATALGVAILAWQFHLLGVSQSAERTDPAPEPPNS